MLRKHTHSMIPGDSHVLIKGINDEKEEILYDLTLPTLTFEMISHDAGLSLKQNSFHNCVITVTQATVTGLETKTYYGQKHRIIPELKIRHLLNQNIVE